MLSGGASLEFAVSKKPLVDEYTEKPVVSEQRKSLLKNNVMASGFNTSFYNRRDTLTFYQPAHGTANAADTIHKVQKSKPHDSLMQPWASGN